MMFPLQIHTKQKQFIKQNVKENDFQRDINTAASVEIINKIIINHDILIKWKRDWKCLVTSHHPFTINFGKRHPVWPATLMAWRICVGKPPLESTYWRSVWIRPVGCGHHFKLTPRSQIRAPIGPWCGSKWHVRKYMATTCRQSHPCHRQSIGIG